MNFFKEKSKCVLQEHYLLLSRWGRYCNFILNAGRTSSDIIKHGSFFKKRQYQLRDSYLDSVHRFERMFEHHLKDKRQNLYKEVNFSD